MTIAALAQPPVEPVRLGAAVGAAERALLERQQPDGHWVFELEADATIPAEYVMLEHYLDEIDDGLQAKLAVYLRRVQNEDGGWPLFYRGDSDISASVKAYYALKMSGDSVDAAHMVRARERILALGGAAKCNVFTRIALALFGQVPWRAVPMMPIEIVLLPRWFFFHLEKMSYWSRTVVVPLLVLMALRPKARNPRNVDIRELFDTPPEREREYLHAATASPLGRAFLLADWLLRELEPVFSTPVRQIAIRKALAFVTERLNGEDGLGAIFPAMANSVMAFDALGYAKTHPDLRAAKKSIANLLVVGDDEAYCQPCVSPIWDTALSAHALFESAGDDSREAIARANAWLSDRQILDVRGDWAAKRPRLRPGGWAFQYNNAHYPDVDDSGVVAMALHRQDPGTHREALERAAEWIVGMQSADGGWGAFDVDNVHYHLNHIPFADHGALLDPPTEDVTARCVGFLLQYGYDHEDPAVARGLDYLRRTQRDDGSWFGRWGTNYIYGTWSVLNAFMAAGENARNSETVARAVGYLLAFQQGDGGWGEDGATYWDERHGQCKASTPSQTAWATLGLIAAGEAAHPTTARGVRYLLDTQAPDGTWDEPWFTAVGFPRVFYLRYHGYCAFFPLMALARYRNVTERSADLAVFGF
ncbi:MAG: squalene--hopene cyclase [Candidatus Eremiobacteraeota bacterium]|nr:squalene--hopene cyclase [Candidatus Eremiobacteraeota bacterium]